MANNGKWLEKLIEKGLKDFQEAQPSFYHRFYDSAAAGSFLPTQPGDYLWLIPNFPAILLEVKSTEKSAPLKSLIKPAQFGKHRLWMRAGHLSAFIYGDSSTGALRWHWGRNLLLNEGSTDTSVAFDGATSDALQMLKKVATTYS